MHNRACFFAIVVLLAFGMVGGCSRSGPPLATVKGQVTLNDKPVTSGIVIFQSEDGLVNVMDDLDSEGNYELRTHDAAGLPPGTYKISLKPAAPVLSTPPLADDGQRNPIVLDKTIPAKYYDAATSGLIVEVTLDKTQYDLQLTP
jgi:hypothetical protein